MPDEDRNTASGDYTHRRFAPELGPGLRETIARAIHQAYRDARRGEAADGDFSVAGWDSLPEYLKESNRRQADHIFDKLRRIGCTVAEVTGRDIALMEFTEDEIEVMAEMEHTRWQDERLLDGWRWGERRDVAKKTSPYLVDWSELSEEVKERDRQAVRRIPELLAGVGLEVQRRT